MIWPTIASVFALVVVIIIEGATGALFGVWWLVPSFTAVAAVALKRHLVSVWALIAVLGLIGFSTQFIALEAVVQRVVALVGAGVVVYVLETYIIVGEKRSLAVRSGIFAACLLIIEWLLLFIQVGPGAGSLVVASRIIEKIALTVVFAWCITVVKYITYHYMPGSENSSNAFPFISFL